MKHLLSTLLLVFSPSLMAAQTVVQSMQTVNNDKLLEMTITGKRDGRPFRHTLHFDVINMTEGQRDSLYQQVLQSLSLLDITNVPGMKKAVPDTKRKSDTALVVIFQCETCTGKGYLEVSGGNFLSTRLLNSKRDPQKRFPLTLPLSSGDYSLLYRQRGQQDRRLTFSVKTGETNVVTLK